MEVTSLYVSEGFNVIIICIKAPGDADIMCERERGVCVGKRGGGGVVRDRCREREGEDRDREVEREVEKRRQSER